MIAKQDRMINPDLERFMAKRAQSQAIELTGSHAICLAAALRAHPALDSMTSAEMSGHGSSLSRSYLKNGLRAFVWEENLRWAAPPPRVGREIGRLATASSQLTPMRLRS